jgi:hypothetical protein
MRAVVLEAITSLEAFVGDRVFSLLREQLDPLLMTWLENKTRMDFDSRLRVLTPVALGQEVDTRSRLWNDYKKAKEIRNKVTHIGRKVSRDEAKFVMRTVYDWLSFLGSTVEVELALLGLKKAVEQSSVRLRQERDAIELVQNYFSRTKAASSLTHPSYASGSSVLRPDLVLEFGEYTVLVEVKLSHKNLFDLLSRAVPQTLAYLQASGISRGAIIVFSRVDVPESYEGVRTLEDGQISLAVVKVQ